MLYRDQQNTHSTSAMKNIYRCINRRNILGRPCAEYKVMDKEATNSGTRVGRFACRY